MGVQKMVSQDKEIFKIENLEEYKKVAPSICMDYLIEGLTPIWAN